VAIGTSEDKTVSEQTTVEPGLYRLQRKPSPMHRGRVDMIVEGRFGQLSGSRARPGLWWRITNKTYHPEAFWEWFTIFERISD
jgi:hypothetical protein